MRLLVSICVLVAALLATQSVICQSTWYEKVMQIKPGVSTKEEVERIFIPSVSDVKKHDTFEQGYYATKWGRIFVNYYLGSCADGVNKYDFKPGTVMYFSFDPKKQIRMSDLGLTTSDFLTEEENDSPGVYHQYRSGGLVYFSVQGKLRGIELSLTDEQRKKHVCTRD